MAQSTQNGHSTNILIGSAAIFVVMVWAGAGAWLYDLPERGTFGDMFGAVNALFSGLAFVGVIYAILLQRQELALQRIELELTRKELARSAEAQEQSQQSLMRQAFSGELSAQVSAISSLLTAYDDERKRAGAGVFEIDRMKELEARRGALLAQLDEIYERVVPE
jgi:hypothetical protein